ncbi:MauE/DoxX family redox-associated membrane protein [Streptomyces sp. NPDC058239]|uniref:MauE/DoxX family redox-associated membrane protein n=1 Tax=unclassified Streptomyces TaxID=2593676 RepID=UPI0036696447
MEYVAAGARGLVGVVFLMSVVGKLAGRSALGAFVSSVRDMRVVPQALVQPMAWTVVGAESLVCVLLAMPVTEVAVAAFAIAAGLLAAFSAGIALALRRGVHSPCRCFGRSTTPLGIPHMARNAVLGAAACAGALTASAPGDPEPGGVLLTVFVGMTIGAFIASLDDILALFRPVKNPTVGTARSLR